MYRAKQQSSTGYPITHIFMGACILGLFIATYHSVLSWMYIRYTGIDSYYSHGFLIPFVSGFFIWQKREDLKSKTISVSWWGLIFIVGALLLHLLGTILYIFSVSGFSIFLFVVGLCLFLFGKDIFREILFPIFFLIFMFPLPEAFLILVAFPLKNIVTGAGAFIAAFFGVPVFRQGFHIFIPAGDLLVGNPCSGLRSIIALLALGAIFAYVSRLSIAKKILLFFLAIPAAIFSNIIRVLLLVLIAQTWGISAVAPDTTWHMATGVLVFILALLLMLIFTKILELKKSDFIQKR